jgi:hypothetical protein
MSGAPASARGAAAAARGAPAGARGASASARRRAPAAVVVLVADPLAELVAELLPVADDVGHAEDVALDVDELLPVPVVVVD